MINKNNMKNNKNNMRKICHKINNPKILNRMKVTGRRVKIMKIIKSINQEQKLIKFHNKQHMNNFKIIHHKVKAIVNMIKYVKMTNQNNKNHSKLQNLHKNHQKRKLKKEEESLSNKIKNLNRPKEEQTK